jgi:hypothetical protein
LPAPEAYQVDSTGQEVSTGWTPSYSVSDSVVTFSGSGGYDANQSLVIRLRDGQTTNSSSQDWITYFGGTDGDGIGGSDIDGDGNFYIGGTTFSTSFPEVDPGMVQIVGNPGFQFPYMARFNTDASLAYLTVIGGNGPENGYDISVSDKAYLVGRTLAADFPATNGTPSPAVQGFIASFSLSDGSFVSSTVLDFLEGAETELYCASAVGKRIFVGGVATGDFSTTESPSWDYYDSTNGILFGDDGLILEFDADLGIVWSTHFGGNEEESIRDIEYTTDGRLFIAGNTTTMSYSATSCGVPTDGGFPSCQPPGSSQFPFANGNSPALEDDIFLAEFDAGGSLSWSTFVGGALRDRVLSSSSIDISGDKVILMGGSEQLSSVQSNTGGGYQQSISDEGYFIAEFVNRSLSWKTDYGCWDEDPNILSLSQSVTYDDDGNYYVLGRSDCSTPVSSMDYCSPPSSGEFALCPPAAGVFYEDIYQGGIDLFLAAFSSSHAIEYATYFGGNNSEFVSSVLAADDLLYFTGTTFSDQSFPLSFPVNAYEQDYNAGENDGFIARLNVGTIVSTEEAQAAVQGIQVFPNPATDLLTVRLPENLGSNALSARIYDMTGKLVGAYLVNRHESTLPISGLPTGVYQIVVENYTSRFVKQ